MEWLLLTSWLSLGGMTTWSPTAPNRDDLGYKLVRELPFGLTKSLLRSVPSPLSFVCWVAVLSQQILQYMSPMNKNRKVKLFQSPNCRKAALYPILNTNANISKYSFPTLRKKHNVLF
jgi:hypothetical protein